MNPSPVRSSIMSYEDRQTQFIDHLIDSLGVNPTFTPYMPDKNFSLDMTVFDLYELIKSKYSDIRVRIESFYTAVFYLPIESQNLLTICVAVPSYSHKDGIVEAKKLNDASINLVCEFTAVRDHLKNLDEIFADRVIIEPEPLETQWVQLQPNNSLQYRSMPIKETPKEIIPEAYPWLEDPKAYITNYVKSQSPILIMSGPPGTGKSTFIRHIINAIPKFEVFSVYDEDIMKRDDLYTNFISNSKEALLVIEDADRLLERRIEDQNTTMSKILNVSDGIIDLTMKKIIFTTNIENTNDVDQALIRPGRCFDILEFRNLDHVEAEALSVKIGKNLPERTKNGYPLAEIFNSKNTPRAQKFGF